MEKLINNNYKCSTHLYNKQRTPMSLCVCKKVIHRHLKGLNIIVHLYLYCVYTTKGKYFPSVLNFSPKESHLLLYIEL